MKMRSLKTMAVWFAMATMAISSTSFAAHHSDRQAHISRLENEKIKLIKDRLGDQLHVIINSLNTIVDAQGNNPVANPATNNTGIPGLIASQLVLIGQAIDKAGILLENRFGVSPAVIAQLHTATLLFANDIIAYSTAVNTNAPIATQQSLANIAVNDAQAIGAIFASITNDPAFIGLFGTLAIDMEQLVQSYRAVLADANTFGANPAVPNTEGTAATAILVQLHHLADQIANLFVDDLVAQSRLM